METSIENLVGKKRHIHNVPYADGFQITLNNKDRHRHQWYDELNQPISAYGSTYDELIANIAPVYARTIEHNVLGKFGNFYGDDYKIEQVRYIIFNDSYFICEYDDLDYVEITNRTPEQVLEDIKKYIDSNL